MAIITEGGQEDATNSDVLNGTRLLTLGAGTVRIECQSSDYDAANSFNVSMQMPNGATPWNRVPVTTGVGDASTPGIIDDRTALIGTFVIAPGDEGHMVLGFELTGVALVTWRVTHLGG